MPTFASYGGFPIFGRAVKMRTAKNPPARQTNEYPGASGVETLFLGLRGRVTEVEGLLTGSDAASLAAAESLIDSYIDGIGRILIDTYGRSWAAVQVVTFDPVGNIMNGGNGYARRYRAVLQHNL